MAVEQSGTVNERRAAPVVRLSQGPTGRRDNVGGTKRDDSDSGRRIGDRHALHGELTSNDGDPACASRCDRRRSGARVIILNLRDVKDIDSFGVAVLASSHMSAVSRGGRLMISDLSRKLRHLRDTRLDTVFEMYESEADAIADCRATD